MLAFPDRALWPGDDSGWRGLSLFAAYAQPQSRRLWGELSTLTDRQFNVVVGRLSGLFEQGF